MMIADKTPAPKYKYGEGPIMDEIKTYVDSTYTAHYIGEDNIQAMDLIAAGGMLMHFAASSIIKYAFRFGKKDGYNRKDILKVIHYAMFMLWQLDKETATKVVREFANDMKIPYQPDERESYQIKGKY